jgi:hypothetical protein
VGPTADDVEDKEDYGTDPATLKKLQDYAEMVFPFLKDAQVIGSYSGLRPATEFRDYQIYSNLNEGHRKWITVGGIRSTGTLEYSPFQFTWPLVSLSLDSQASQHQVVLANMSQSSIANCKTSLLRKRIDPLRMT